VSVSCPRQTRSWSSCRVFIRSLPEPM
jgi:hypothetical protein